MIFLDLARNIAILLALCMGYTMVFRMRDRRSLSGRILAGFVFGSATVIGMLTPVVFAPGVIFDGRSILISVAGLFAGGLPALIAAAIASVCRIAIGGGGVYMGCGVIVTSAALGAGYRHLRRRNTADIKTASLLLFGLVVHFAMLLWTMALPEDVRWQVLRTIALPVLLVYPVGTALAGRLLANQDAWSDSEKALRESEERYRAVAEDTPVLICSFRPGGEIAYANEIYCKYFEKTSEELVGSSFLSLIPDVDRETVMGNISALTVESPMHSHEHRVIAPDGEIRWQRWTNRALFDAKGQPVVYQSIGEDITERKQAEEELRMSNRALTVLSECNQELVRATDEGDLLRSTCRILVEKGAYRLAWVGFAEQDEAKSVRPVAQMGYVGGYLDTIAITWDDTERGRGPTGTAIRTGRPVAARDIQMDPNFAPWREAALEHGYASSIALPLMVGEQAFGALNIYSSEPDAFDEEEVQLLLELANDVAYGVMALRSREERKRAEEALRENERFREGILNDMTTFVGVLDPSGGLIFVNNTPLAVAGIELADVSGKKFFEAFWFTYSDEAREVIKRDIEQCAAGESLVHDIQIQTADGSLMWIEYSMHPIFDEHGVVKYLIPEGRDITERKRAEEELGKYREHLEELVRERTAELAKLSAEQQLILDSVRAMIWYKDTKNNFLRANRAASESVGLAVEEIEGKSTEELFPQEAAKYYQDDLEVIQSGQPKLGIVEPLRTSSGAVLWVLTDKMPVLDKSGAVTGIIVFSIDITERKQAQEKAERRSEELRSIVNSMAGRENRMVGLKKAVRKLRAQLEEAGMTPVADDPIAEGRSRKGELEVADSMRKAGARLQQSKSNERSKNHGETNDGEEGEGAGHGKKEGRGSPFRGGDPRGTAGRGAE
ncbi:MAG: PAS domain S-box protein [Nitrospiraceae bacterium]|nr:PAS domain S-box protein [Nitrospiraceae bacterium]